MKRIDTPDAPGRVFSAGTAALGYLDSTVVPAWFVTMLQEEFMAFLAAANTAPDESGVTLNQVLASAQRLFVSSGGGLDQAAAPSHRLFLDWTGQALRLGVDAYDIGLIAMQPSKGSNANGIWRIASDGGVRMWGEVLQPLDGSGFNQVHVTFPIPFPNGLPPTGVSVTTTNTTPQNNGASYSAKAVNGMNVAMAAPYSFSWEAWQ